MDPQTAPPISILRLHTVADRVGMGRSWIYREVAAGRFPQPIKIGSSTGWASTEIDKWLLDLIAARAAGRGHEKVLFPKGGRQSERAMQSR